LLQADALAYHDLVSQPLLLLMLALYAADPATRLEHGLTSAALYERLLATFLRREVAKLNLGDHAEREAEQRLWRLTVAAFGMFNRGGLYIMDTELGADRSGAQARAGGCRTKPAGREPTQARVVLISSPSPWLSSSSMMAAARRTLPSAMHMPTRSKS
jgi:hypothetical protein